MNNELTLELKDLIKKNQGELKEKVKTDDWRLIFHQQPPTGWLNDPNGVCQFNGKYHLYYQYSPINPKKGVVYWGHKTSDDMVHFRDEEIFLYPDQKFDCHGVYSGSAFVKNDEIHYFYTGNVKHSGKEHDYIVSGREQNTIHVVSKDGFEIDTREVVIDSTDYPDGFSQHIRDPKVFERNDKYYMVLGGRSLDDRGAILLYQSTNLYDWEYHTLLLEGNTEMGYMWECPDLFNLDGFDVLVMSPQGINEQKYKFKNKFQSGYYLGNVNEKMKFSPQGQFVELDRGFDFYAPQTFEDEKGRRLIWGWMAMDGFDNPTVEKGWQHTMALPRELTVENGVLKQRPLQEYEMLRKNEYTFNGNLNEGYEKTKLKGEVYELLIDFKESTKPFILDLRQDTVITFENGLFTLKHGESGYGRDERVIELEEINQVRIFSDTSSLEIFLNDGEYVLSTRVYPEKGSDTISLESNHDVSIKKWDLV